MNAASIPTLNDKRPSNYRLVYISVVGDAMEYTKAHEHTCR